VVASRPSTSRTERNNTEPQRRHRPPLRRAVEARGPGRDHRHLGAGRRGQRGRPRDDAAAARDVGLHGRDRGRRRLPAVAIVDIGLPKLDGYELARQIRARTDGPPRLIAVTGYGQPEDRRQALAAGFDHHLPKPVDADALALLLRSCTPRRGITA